MTPAFRWSDAEVRAALGLPPSSGEEERHYSRITTDSRMVRGGELFVALIGERFDGHDFVERALEQGAAAAVVSRLPEEVDPALLYRVDDTLAALGALARHRRRALAARVVGVTGSSGKTTTKELIRGALETRLRVHATHGNLNNRIGAPQTLLSAPDDAEVVVVEIGTNEPGEIATLTSVAEPDVGVVTTVAESHLEGLGSLEGVMAEKLSLIGGLGREGVGIVGDDPPALAEEARRIRGDVRVAGFGPEADEAWRGSELRADEEGRYSFRWKGAEVALRIPGRHAAQDAAIALTVADALGVPAGDAAVGAGAVEPHGMRSEIREVGPFRVIVDCYNANPQSVRAAIELLEILPSETPRGPARKIAVLGTMLELGARSGALHRAVLEEVMGARVDVVVAVGAFAEAARGIEPAEGRPALLRADEVEEVRGILGPLLSGGEWVLLKASRGVRLERVIEAIETLVEGE